MKKQRSFFARLRERLDVSCEQGRGGFCLTLLGQSTLEVYARVRICTYSEESVRVIVGKRVLCVEGRRLLCREFGVERLQIVGKILSIRFEEKQNEG